eukprot:6288586-Lingulodinium_polyedra.AAC.1
MTDSSTQRGRCFQLLAMQSICLTELPRCFREATDIINMWPANLVHSELLASGVFVQQNVFSVASSPVIVSRQEFVGCNDTRPPESRCVGLLELHSEPLILRACLRH